MTVSARIDEKVANRAMLSHPFYQAWTEGRLPLDTLRDYARQYFHHVEAFPRAVSAVHSACPDRDGRRMLAENLAEEEGIEAGKQDHASLWLMFAAGLGEGPSAVRSQPLNPETQALIETFGKLSRRSYASGLGALYTYESQFPAVATAKIEGLVDRYGINDEPTLRCTRPRTSSTARCAGPCSTVCLPPNRRRPLPPARSSRARCGISFRAWRPARP
jgi:pyrroloquinoline-quinone synthase